MSTKIYCEGYNHFTEISDTELEQKGINSIEELHTFYGSLCLEHLSTEFNLCDKCFKRGFSRYDSLVLCNIHNNEFMPTITKLYDVLTRNATVITDLGL